MLNYATEEQLAITLTKLPKIGDWVEIDPDGTQAQCTGYKIGKSPNRLVVNVNGEASGYHLGLDKEVLILEEQLTEIKPDFDLYSLR
jgi:hypothetical protein